MYSIDSGTKTRSTHTVGNKPDIDNM